jgi:ABC-2 type transport system ATP-binding protein
MLAVSLRGVSKRYRIYSSQRERLKGALTFGRGAGRDFWALKDIDLDVEKGTALGVLGRNGAGKSTLFRTISGVLQPTRGTVQVNGRMVALFQLGAGFNDDFTGRENILLNGLILGIERREMLELYDEIAAFADIGEFMDQPLKTYSSGMRGRLGFAVAVNVKPDVLLVDETLSTGDAVFKARGIQKMRELRDSGATILFVSHSASQVRNFCTEAALLHKGQLISRGESGEVADEYHDLVSRAARKQKAKLEGLFGEEMFEEIDDLSGPDLKRVSSAHRNGTGEARVGDVEILDDAGSPVEVVTPDSNLTVRVPVHYAQDVEGSALSIGLNNEAGLEIFSTSTDLEDVPLGDRRSGERAVVEFNFPVPLKNGRYSVSASVTRGKNASLDRVGVAAVFKVFRPQDRGAFPGLVHLPTRVTVHEADPARRGGPSG